MRAIASPAHKSSPILGWTCIALIAIALSLTPLLSQNAILNPNGWPQLHRFLTAALHPDLTLDLLAITANALLTTLAYAVCGSVLSLILGSVLSLLCSEVGWQTLNPSRPGSTHRITATLRFLLTLPRTIHGLIWGLIFINIWGSGSITGILAIAIPFGLITSKVFAEILDDSPRQAWQTLLNSGAHPWTAFIYGLLPQAKLNLISYAFYRFECSLRSAAVLGMIGVGGLGTEIHVSLQSLRYEQLWTFFYALVFLNGCVDWASATARQRLGCATRLAINGRSRSQRHSQTALSTSSTPSNPNSNQPEPVPQSGRLTFTSVLPWLLIPGLSIFCFWHLAPDLNRLTSPRSRDLALEFITQALPPNWSLLPSLPGLMLQTLAMSVVAIAIATLFGTSLAFLSARTIVLPGGLLTPQSSPSSALSSRLTQLTAWATLLGSRTLLLFARAIPSPIWALVLLYVLFPGILPGAIALAIHNGGILGRLKAEAIENLDTPPLESLSAQGLSASMIFCYGILPLTLPRFLAYDFYRWEVCLRETVIVGLVGAGGLGYLLREQVSGFDYASLSATLLGFTLLTLAVDSLSNRARQALR